MKKLEEGRFDRAWGGIASLSVALAAVWTEASKRGFTLANLTRWLSTAPAQLAGLQHLAGSLAEGREATFFVFDPEAELDPDPRRPSLPPPHLPLPRREAQRPRHPNLPPRPIHLRSWRIPHRTPGPRAHA